MTSSGCRASGSTPAGGATSSPTTRARRWPASRFPSSRSPAGRMFRYRRRTWRRSAGRTARLLISGWRRRRVRGEAAFFPPQESASPPEIAGSIVQGKDYSLSQGARVGVLRRSHTADARPHVEVDLAGSRNRQGPVFGDPRLAPQRLGQQAFPAPSLFDMVGRRIMISGTYLTAAAGWSGSLRIAGAAATPPGPCG